MIEIHFDGGTRINGICIYDSKLDFYDVVRYKTKFTNNQLEYMALINAVYYVTKKYSIFDDIVFVGDSELIIKQMKEEYKVSNSILLGLKNAVDDKFIDFLGHPATADMFKWVPRYENKAGIYLEALR